MARIYWRGKSLWLDIPNKGKRIREQVIQRLSDSPSEIRRCEKLGRDVLGKRLVQAKEGKVFEIEKPEYTPKTWRIIGRYWRYHLRFRKSAKKDVTYVRSLLRQFGGCYAKALDRSQIESWLHTLRTKFEVNTVNNYLTYLKSIYSYANADPSNDRRLEYNPTKGLKKLKGGKVRSFLLDERTFERNLSFLTDVRPDFAGFYLALWETGRRPMEVALYSWEMVNLERQSFAVPSSITKTGIADEIPISDRLFNSMLRSKDRQGYVFKNSKGNPWLDYKRCAERLKKQFGKDCGWIRDTRRAFCTRKVEKEGHDPLAVMAVTGHKTISTFQRYHIGSIEGKRKVVGSTVSMAQK